MSGEVTLNKQFVGVDYDPFNGLEMECIVDCTEPQIEILTACLLGEDNAAMAFNESISLKFDGLLNLPAMQYALQKVISRHQSLRATISIKNKQLCIFKHLPIQLAFHDISLQEKLKQQEYIEDFLLQDSLHLFDLINGPLFKAGLIRSNDNEHLLVLTTHHIICDGWSLGIILQDLGKIYSAYTQNVYLELAAPALFSHFAKDQRKFIQNDEYQLVEAFWLDQYKDAVPVLNMPTAFVRPPVRTYKSARLDYKLDTDLFDNLKALGTKSGCSLVTTLLAAFETFLFRLTSQEDIVVGLPAAGQSITANYHLVGHCVNLLPLRSKPTADISFSAYLKNRKTQIFDAYENQQITFGSLLKKIKLPRDSSRIPLVPVVFNIDMGLADGVYFDGLKYELISNPRSNENFELFLNISGYGNNLTFEWSHNTLLFTPGMIDGMMADFKQVLKVIIANPATALADIDSVSLIQPEEFTNLLSSAEVNNEYVENIVELIEQQVTKFPGNTALVYKDEKVTYRELNALSNQLAHYLRSKGVTTNSIVPICIGPGINMIVAIIGILKAGAAYVPIDTAYPLERIQYMLTDVGSPMLVCSKAISDTLKNQSIEMIVLDEQDLLCNQPHTNLQLQIKPNHLAYIIYTSGSTGRPKGVMIENAALSNYLLNSKANYVNDQGCSSGTFIHLSYSFDASVTGIFMPLLFGKTIVIGSKNDVEVFEDINLQKYAPYDFIKITPAHLDFLKPVIKDSKGKLLTSKLVVGGEALKLSHFEYLIDKDIDITIINEYGPTEATVGCSTYSFQTIGDGQRTANGISIGKPIDNAQIYIVDKKNKLVPLGAEGEICIGGAGVARGYLNRPDLTSEKFIPNPFSKKDGAKIYKTGDTGRWLADGNISYAGRTDDQLKIRGYRIEPGEIENMLESVPGIEKAVVMCKRNNVNDPRLVAYIIADEGLHIGMQFPKEQISSWKKAIGLTLPSYMIPTHFEMVASFPLTSNGKIDRNALPEPFLNTSDERNDGTAFTENEKLLSDIWTKALDIKNISLIDNFFEIGGHSLIAIDVVTRIEKLTGKKLPPSILFQHSTIAQLALVLEDKAGIKKWESLVAIKPSGNKDPLYLVHGSGLDVMIFNNVAKYMDEDQPVYGLKAKGKDGDSEILESIEEMATFYISEMMQQNPQGPYAIVGYSAGALIAFEMAKQLKALNKEIKMLGVIDYDLEEPHKHNKFRSKFERNTVELFPRLFYVFRSFIKHSDKALKYQVMCLRLRFITMVTRLGIKKAIKLEGLYMHIETAWIKYEKAMKNYVVRPVDISIDLFSTKIKMYYLKDFKYLGWKPFAEGGMKIHEIPGDHDDMLLPPNDKKFAQVLQDVLNTNKHDINEHPMVFAKQQNIDRSRYLQYLFLILLTLILESCI
ncbi:MAG: amino acid adenylation domain-containing protein [Ferruginibacter sp.]